MGCTSSTTNTTASNRLSKSIITGSLELAEPSKVPPPLISSEHAQTMPFNSNPGGKILMKALRSGDWKRITYCMANAIGQHYRDQHHGFTPLHQFLFHRTYQSAPSPEVCQQFIHYQLHCLNIGDKRQATPLHFAIWYVEEENYYITYELLKQGADRTLKDGDGLTPMDYAGNDIFQKRKASFVMEHYDSDVSLEDLMSKSASFDEEEGKQEKGIKVISEKKKSAKLELMMADIHPVIV